MAVRIARYIVWAAAITLVVAAAAIVAIMSKQQPQPLRSGVMTHVLRTPQVVRNDPTVERSAKTSAAIGTLAPRQRFRAATNYAQLVKELGPSALDGNPEAQYVMAEALRWCDKTLRLYFIWPNGQARTLEEVEAMRASRPAGISTRELETIYARCQGFLEDPAFTKIVGSWNEWLDKSAAQNYPAAVAERARLLEDQAAIGAIAQTHDTTTDAAQETQAREMALQAVQSGDPDAIFSMGDFVRTGTRTSEETATVIDAWKILACQKGYDCGPDSDFMHTVCDWDAQCADGKSYTDYFQRQLGTGYDDAIATAKIIDRLIAAKDTQGLRSYL